MGRIYTSYFENEPNFPKDAYLISISDETPIPVNLKMKELVPNEVLVRLFRERRVTEIEYKNCYLIDLKKSSITPEKLTKMLKGIAKGHKNTLLLCSEHPDDFCHRHIVAEMVPELGIKEYPVYKRKE